MQNILDNGTLPGPLTLMFVAVWFGAMLWLGLAGVFATPNGLPVSNLQLAIVIPMVLFWTLFAFAPPFRRYVLGLDFLFLNLMQTWRMMGGAIFVLWGYGLVPGGFAVPMSVLDMSVGILAVYVVIVIVRRSSMWRVKAWVLNLWGFADFWITIALALFAFIPLSFDPAFVNTPQATLVHPPLSIFPSFAIPFFSCLHFCAIAQLATRK
ncbi:hypothetical protein [Hyphobacterium sp.]|uniref:hypothetical protein n=1 Tax=Hyphobacterium sp. TaxID=2004662 RepID=UPI0037492662